MKVICKVCLLILLLIPLNSVFAAFEQEATLSIEPGIRKILYYPDNFFFETTFFDPLAISPSTTYKTLPPGLMYEDLTPEQIKRTTLPNQIAIEDAEGNAFEIQLHFGNLIDNNKIIPFSDISMVTLANDPSGIDIFTANSPPASTVDVASPIACLGWNNNIQANCEIEFNNNMFTSNTELHNNDPSSNIDAVQINIPVDSTTQYSINSIIEFSNGEKALVTAVAPDNSEITIRRGILGTTATPHPALSGITCHGPNSKSVTIITFDEHPSRIGAYTAGFGFKLLVQPHFEFGNYSGLITIDITP